jgi:hypothetical protein
MGLSAPGYGEIVRGALDTAELPSGEDIVQIVGFYVYARSGLLQPPVRIHGSLNQEQELPLKNQREVSEQPGTTAE